VKPLLCSEEVIQKVLAAILVARLRNCILIHNIVVGMVALPRLLLVLSGYPGLLLALKKGLASSQVAQMQESNN
jgi:hypothetical protein